MSRSSLRYSSWGVGSNAASSSWEKRSLVVASREVARDAEQPRCRVADLPVVAIARGPCAQEHLGGELFGSRGGQPAAQPPVDPRMVALEELLEGLRARRDELGVCACPRGAHTCYLPDRPRSVPCP
jgi:hypothetical protein